MMANITLLRASSDILPSQRILAVLLSMVLIGTFNTTHGFKMNPPDYQSTSKEGIFITLNFQIDLHAVAKLHHTLTTLLKFVTTIPRIYLFI